jgi:hypothetical protein
LAQGLTDRPTDDLDFFRAKGDVTTARDAFETAAAGQGWTVRRQRDTATFVRLVVNGGEEVVVDLCLDAPPARPPAASVVGPTFAPDELAGRKVIALFDRAEARDFADVYALSRRFSRPQLLALAAEVDDNFDADVFAEMLATIDRHDDARLTAGGDDPAAVRDFFRSWTDELST